MSFQDIFEDQEWEERLSPHVVIAANDFERFKKTAEMLEKNGINCEVVTNSVQLMAAAGKKSGSVVFVSWNLKGANVKGIVRSITEGLKSNCIAFAEDDGVKTRAELAASQIKDKIQAPFSDKNFLLAVKSIINDRGKQKEALVRKKRVHDRMAQAYKPKEKKKVQGDILQTRKTEEEINGEDILQSKETQKNNSSSLTQSGPTDDEPKSTLFQNSANEEDETHTQSSSTEKDQDLLQSADPDEDQAILQRATQETERLTVQTSVSEEDRVVKQSPTSEDDPVVKQGAGDEKELTVVQRSDEAVNESLMESAEAISDKSLSQKSKKSDPQQVTKKTGSSKEKKTLASKQEDQAKEVLEQALAKNLNDKDQSDDDPPLVLSKNKKKDEAQASLDDGPIGPSIPSRIRIEPTHEESLGNAEEEVSARQKTLARPVFGPMTIKWLLIAIGVASTCLLIILYLLIFERYNIFK